MVVSPFEWGIKKAPGRGAEGLRNKECGDLKIYDGKECTIFI